ncbi:MAG: LytTR family transcriptional regulator [Bacteroidales bacterium]|nr:LytTR family transcriptional regulator [Bacteroidales bacterium]
MEMPKYLFSKGFLTVSVLVIFLFSIPFLLIYRPFSATIWIGFQPARHFAFTIVFYLIAIILMGLSKMAMYYFQSRRVLTAGKFILWALSEYLVIALVYLALTPAATGNTLHADLPLIFKAALCVGLILAIPYGYMSLIAANRALREEYEALRAGIGSEDQSGKLLLHDYKGDPAIALDADSIFYMEAQDNYVQIYYESEGKQHKYMLRCPTQKLESAIAGTTLVRCHRSYIVNLGHLEQFMRGHNCATIVLDNPDRKEVSVSKSYYKQTLARLLELNPSQDKFVKRT